MNKRTTDISKIEQTNQVRLCIFNSEKPFDKVVADFEKQLGHFDQAKILSSADLPKTVKAMEGTSGLMIASILETGKLLPALASSSVQAKQYLIGNPLISNIMAEYNMLAALYTPPRVLIYTNDGKTWISYDLPSTSFSRFSSPEIDLIAQNLDQKFENLARVALS